MMAGYAIITFRFPTEGEAQQFARYLTSEHPHAICYTLENDDERRDETVPPVRVRGELHDPSS